ncbi:uncharacterized protein LOC142232784 isoform X1 [Haematobia irritans]|uniref:uncharacterized protein LOC142232784 isoform X1 n=1 Tax=Haematobia irritans TaxID=7368 RepID=UPI003F4F76C9
MFETYLVEIFVGVFEKVRENIRELMYYLRQTWIGVFSELTLYCLDIRIKTIDQNWPITAKKPLEIIEPSELANADEIKWGNSIAIAQRKHLTTKKLTNKDENDDPNIDPIIAMNKMDIPKNMDCLYHNVRCKHKL